MPPLAFISYSKNSLEIADAWRSELRKRGIECWMSKYDLTAAVDYAAVIPGIIEECTAFVLIFNRYSQESEHVRREVGLAIRARRAMVPIQTEPCEITRRYRYLLDGVQRINAIGEVDSASQEVCDLIFRLKQMENKGMYREAVLGLEAEEQPDRSGYEKELRGLLSAESRKTETRSNALTTGERIEAILEEVNNAGDVLVKVADSELRDCYLQLRERHQSLPQDRSCEDMLSVALAIAREALDRNLEHAYDDEVRAAAALCLNMVADTDLAQDSVRTVCMAAAFKSLARKGVHVYARNDSMALRDGEVAYRLLYSLGISVGILSPDMDEPRRRDAYAADVTYGSVEQFCFDFMRDTRKANRSERVQRGTNQAIVCNADLLLLDRATQPFRLLSYGMTEAVCTPHGLLTHYDTLAGLSESAESERACFRKLYGLGFTRIEPLFRSLPFQHPTEVWLTDEQKWSSVARIATRRLARLQPVLVNVASTEDASRLLKALASKRIHARLVDGTAPSVDLESMALAGTPGEVTVVVAYSGYDTISPLGGDPEYVARNIQLEAGCGPEVAREIAENQCASDEAAAIESGGLFAIGAFVHRLPRLQSHFVNHVVRRHAPGEYVFVLSAESDVTSMSGTIKKCAEDNGGRIPYHYFDYSAKSPSKMLDREAIERERQCMVERERSVEVDDLLDWQRDSVDALVNRIRGASNKHVENVRLIEGICARAVARYCKGEPKDWDYLEMERWFVGVFGIRLPRNLYEIAAQSSAISLSERVTDQALDAYRDKMGVLKNQVISGCAALVITETANVSWARHLSRIEEQRKAIEACIDAKNDSYTWNKAIKAYKARQTRLCDELLAAIEERYIRTLFRLEIQKQTSQQRACKEPEELKDAHYSEPEEDDGEHSQVSAPRRASERAPMRSFTPYRKAEGTDPYAGVGRNDPCPCGSGKKFKNCHGRND